MRFFLLTIMVSCLISSCSDNRLFEENKTLDQAWLANNTVQFQFEIKDTSQPYNVYYNIRNSLDFPYARLFVNDTLKDTTGVIVDKKLNSQYLFNLKTGEPLGNSGIGDVFDHQFLILKEHRFNHAGKYWLELSQFNREDTLKGVIAVGARVEYTINKK